MTESQMTTMTLEELQVARARGESLSDWARIKREQAAGLEPAEDEDSPEATQLLQAEVTKRRAGRPKGSGVRE